MATNDGRAVWMVVLAALMTATAAGALKELPSMPMEYDREDSIRTRWIEKEVLKSRLLDDMEDLSTWEHHGFGGVSLTTERSRDGEQSLRLVSPTKGEKPGGVMGRPFGAAVAIRKVPGEDWSDYNRLSVWVYPTLPGFRVVSLCMVLHNDGDEKVPGPYGRNGRNFVILEPDRWNHVVWEITHLGRDKVTGVELTYRLQGNEPGAASEVTYDFDRLELQKVDADHFEGWNVAPGQISFCHAGYATHGPKQAFVSGLDAKEFTLADARTGRVVRKGKVQRRQTALGTFEILDFTDCTKPGRYILQAGDVRTRPFDICDSPWRDSIVKTVNFFYTERCGDAIDGIHDICHRDWMCLHGDRSLPIHGGWHDAGDLSQGLVNTSEAVYAMLALARELKDAEPLIARRLIDEAKWGIDWVLKTRFGDGFRCTWATMDFWTDGILGNVDDVTSEARNSPFENFCAVCAEALAARTLRGENRIRADYCLQAAEQDWAWAMEKARGTAALELAAGGLQASLDLYEATDKAEYAGAAAEFARTVVACQKRSPEPDWDIPLTGYFCSDTGKSHAIHYAHRGHEQAPAVGLVRMCRLFPDHPDWIDWYAALVLYSEYYRTVAGYNEPWGMIPASIYAVDESGRDTFRQQVENGVRVGPRHRLRRFPVWFDFRGNHGTALSQTKGLTAIARLRGDADLIGLCEKQLMWVLGRNPFCQSTMWGLGYDFAPQYTAMSGDLVGSLPVGVQTHFDRDEPYWPADNCYNWKEVWVHPSSRWLWIMEDLYTDPAVRPEDLELTARREDDRVRITLKNAAGAPRELLLESWNLDGLDAGPISLAPGQSRQFSATVKDEKVLWLITVRIEGEPGAAEAIGLPNWQQELNRKLW